VVTRFAVISTVTRTATLVAVAATVGLRAIGRESWQSALAVAFAVLGVRVAVMAWGAARRELPWSRLLLPGIILLEGLGLWWRGAAVLWQLRLGTVVGLELAFVVVAIRELRRTTAGAEPLEARIARALAALLPPRAARLVAFELVIVGSALRFVIGGWRRGVPAGFTYHRESALRLLLPILPLLGIGDILFLELVLLPHAATWLRVVVHGLAIYGLIWLVGLYASVRARPHQLVDGRLTLHRGMLRRLTVPVEQIASIDELPSFADDWKKRAYCKGAIRVDVAGPTILELRLRTAARPIGVLGDGAPGTRVLVAVDDPASFTTTIVREAGLATAGAKPAR
jgi:hypothetical protein